MRTIKQRGCYFLFAALAVMSACGTAPKKVRLDPESEKFFETGRLIMTGEERAIFNHLPDAESRKEFIKDFWAKRDPNQDTEVNEFKLDFESRVDYASKRFREGGRGWNTDRGRIYIFMGPPDKTDEYFNHGETDIRGPIIWWIYYDYDLGIEFVDERGMNQFTMRRYTGDFFEAMEILKLGQAVQRDDVFKKKLVKFQLRYDRDQKEFTVTIPADVLSFTEDGDKVRVDLNFEIFIYKRSGESKETLSEKKSFVTNETALIDMKTVAFTFPYVLEAGTHFVDVIIRGREGAYDKVRKIFEIKVK